MRSIERWYFQWPWRTHNPVFKVTAFRRRISQNGVFYGQSFYRILIGNHTQSIEWYHFQWPSVTSDPISRSRNFWNQISEKRRILKTTLLFHRKLYLTCEMILCLVTLTHFDWPLNASREYVSISWSSCWDTLRLQTEGRYSYIRTWRTH